MLKVISKHLRNCFICLGLLYVSVCGLPFRMCHVHLKGIHSSLVILGCNVLKIPIKSNCTVVSFSISVTLLIFCKNSVLLDVYKDAVNTLRMRLPWWGHALPFY